MTSCSQPSHEAAEMVLVEIKEDFAGCASGQHLTVLSFKNSDFFFFTSASQAPKSSLLAQLIQG